MISLEQVKAFRRKMFDYSLDLVSKKGHDYNREQQQGGDTLFNMRVCEILGIVDTSEQGVLTRLSDKFMRLISLTKTKGIENQVKDESVYVTIADIHNYIDYLYLLYSDRKEHIRTSRCSVHPDSDDHVQCPLPTIKG